MLDDHAARGQVDSLDATNQALDVLRREAPELVVPPAAETTSYLPVESHQFVDAVHNTNTLLRQERARGAQAKNEASRRRAPLNTELGEEGLPLGREYVLYSGLDE